ncbi:MAG: pitrilysin family protein [Patescibacteria group bacterium]
MKTDVFTLKNGLKVVLVDTKAFPTISTILLVGAGSRYEDKVNNGVAHFFEHMAFKGSKKYPNSHIIASEVEGAGGVFNAFTNKDHTGYWIKSTSAHFKKVTDVISDMVLNSFLLPEEIEREKGVIVEELNLYNDTPYQKVQDIFETLLYDGNPLGLEIGGHKETVTKFTRETFTDYMDAFYHPNNAVFVVAGGINSTGVSKQAMVDFIDDKFKSWKKGTKKDFIKVQENQKKPNMIIKYKDTEQSHFCLGFRAVSRETNKKYALKVLSAILGGGMSSRLFREVRERRGLCYYISSNLSLYNDVGNIYARAGVTIDLDKTKMAIEVILKEFKKMIDGDIKKEELERAKELIKGRALLNLEDSFEVSMFYGERLLIDGKMIKPEDYIENIQKVTVDQIHQIAKDTFKSENLNLALIGPVKDTKGIEELLTI